MRIGAMVVVLTDIQILDYFRAFTLPRHYSPVHAIILLYTPLFSCLHHYSYYSSATSSTLHPDSEPQPTQEGEGDSFSAIKLGFS